MGRRVIVKREDMYRSRASAWEYHYQNRNIARELCLRGFDGERIGYILIEFCAREIRMDGWLLDVPLVTRQVHEKNTLLACGLIPSQTNLLCNWYWTERAWLEFVRLWQEMPEVEEDYYHLYDPMPNDRLLLVPMSSKSKQGAVDKSGTSKAFEVQLGKKEVVRVRRG